MKSIKTIDVKSIALPARKRVAAYARVSMESDRLAHSLSTQISYYNDLIQNNPEWEFAGVYADSFISGTSVERRAEFKRMIQDCEDGKIDIILTKSISRFARNTVDLLNTVRRLKELGIEVQFEKERIRSLSGDGELMLTLLASFAQEESRSISENVKWGTRKRFENGIPNGKFRVYGYRWEGDVLVPIPEEAAIVKRIFQNFLDGKSRLETEKEFASEGITTREGCPWVDTNIKSVLTNITYTGNLLLQKEFIEDPITKKRRKNRGQLPQYYVENTHEAIIDMDTFQYVQDEIKRRKELGVLANKSLNITCFTGKIKCLRCGKSFMRNIRENRAKHSTTYTDGFITWCCGTKKIRGGRCKTQDIPDKVLKQCCAEVLGLDEFDETVFSERIKRIDVPSSGVLIFHFNDGTETTRTWKSTAKKDCWNEAQKERQRKWMQNYMANDGRFSPFTTRIKCSACGGSVLRNTNHGDGFIWRCRFGCSSKGIKGIRESELQTVSARILGLSAFDGELFKSKVDHITVEPECRLDFCLSDGSHKNAEYTTRIKRKPRSWTAEQKSIMSEKLKASWAKRKQEKKENGSK